MNIVKLHAFAVAPASLLLGFMYSGLTSGYQDEKRDQTAQARKMWESKCSNCHVAPDNDIKRDIYWCNLIKTTA